MFRVIPLAVVLLTLSAVVPVEAQPPAATPPGAPAGSARAPTTASGGAAPATAPAAPPRGRHRMLGGHRFIPFGTVTWPFVTWRFGSDSAIGGSRVTLEDQDAAGPAGDRVASFRSLEQTFRAGLRILPWLGAEAQVRGALAIGADDAGALVLGSSYEYGGALGALVNVVKTPVVVLTVRLDLRLARVEGILPQSLLDSVVVEDGVAVHDLDALTYDAFTARFAPTVSGAFALSSFFGLQASAGLDVVRFGSAGRQDWESRVAAAAGLSVFVSPVSVLFGARIDHDLDRDLADDVFLALEPVDGTRGEIEGAIYYAGRPELDLGLGIRHLVGSRDERTLGTVTLAYYW